MPYTLEDRTLALGGVFQAAALVKQLAYRGDCDRAAASASLNSILRIDSQDVAQVFSGQQGVQLGLKTLLKEVGSGQRDLEITRYVVNLLHLQRKLLKRKHLLDEIATGIARSQEQVEHFGLEHVNTLAGMAEIYAQTISTLTPRIMVNGDARHLQNSDTANRIRALLLGGIRAAVLWNQCGGSRWGLLLRPGRYVETVQRLIAENEQILENHA